MQAALLSLGILSAGGAWSQALPPTGQVGRDTLPAVPPREANPIAAPAPNAGSSNANSATVSVVVKAFTFTGNTSISTEELQAVVAPSLNQQLDLAGLDKVADLVSRHYRTKGYTVARAYLPAQQSANGSIELAVIEGRYGAVNLKNGSEVSDERLRLTLVNNLCDTKDGKDCIGKVVTDAGLERAVLLIKDLPGTTIAASLKPGKALGTSDLDLDAKLVKREAYSLGFDNYGTPATGVVRLNANAEINNLSKNGDTIGLGISTTNSFNTKTGSLSYSLPVGYLGQRAGVAFSRSQYVLGAGFSATQSHGTSNALSAFTYYPLIRSVNQTVYIRGTAEVRTAINSVDLIQASFRSNANVLRVAINGDHIDSFYGGGYNVYSLTVSQGYVGTTDANDASATGAHSAGRFGKLAYSIARQQALDGPATIYANINGQYANKNLDGSEQTGLGGPSSTRGYGGEAGGSTGAAATVELRYTNPIQLGSELGNITYAAFFDRGWVQFYETPIVAGATNTRALSSYGLALTLQSQAKAASPTSTSYYLRAMLGLHSMATGQTSAVDPNSRRKFWIQGGYNF
jgi:hemolysin activation/secretion protein